MWNLVSQIVELFTIFLVFPQRIYVLLTSQVWLLTSPAERRRSVDSETHLGKQNRSSGSWDRPCRSCIADSFSAYFLYFHSVFLYFWHPKTYLYIVYMLYIYISIYVWYFLRYVWCHPSAIFGPTAGILVNFGLPETPHDPPYDFNPLLSLHISYFY